MIFIGLGSNVGNREQSIVEAIRRLDNHSDISVITISSLFETEPVGYKDQPNFLNAVIGIDSQLAPMELLEYCLQVEAALGRIREMRWGPRLIDIDILAYNEVRFQSDKLILPHPRLAERRFVLVPLCEIANNIPVYFGKTPQELLDVLEDTSSVNLYKPLVWQ